MTTLRGARDDTSAEPRAGAAPPAFGLATAVVATLVACPAVAAELVGDASGVWGAIGEALASGDVSILRQPVVAGGLAAVVAAVILAFAFARRGSGTKPRGADTRSGGAREIQRRASPEPRARCAVAVEPSAANGASRGPASRLVGRSESAIAFAPSTSRKLVAAIELKPRDIAFVEEAFGGAIKIPTERFGAIANAFKRKLIPNPESAKRRPAPVPPGRRSASSRSPSP